MSWPIIFRELKKEYERDPARPGVSMRYRTDGEKLVVGDAYYVPEDMVWDHPKGYRMVSGLPVNHLFDTSVRRPILVVLPDGYHFCIDCAYWNSTKPNPARDGWNVQIQGTPIVGEKLMVTLTPSINIVGSYHGWIRDGILSDDCEGRKYP